MKIFVLKKTSGEIKPEHYELNRFIEESKKSDIELECICPNQFDIVITKDNRKSILLNGNNISLPDFIISRLGSATTYYALAVIRHFERLHVIPINNSHSIETAKDKLYVTQILAQNNIPTPKTILVKYPVSVDMVEKYLNFPIVVKVLHGSLGRGVYLSENKSNLIDIMEMLEDITPNTTILLQEFIEKSKGQDLRVFVVGGRIIGCMKRISQNGDFKANFSRGAKVEPFKLNSEIEWLSLESTKLLGLDIAGVDLLFDNEGFKVCEVNSSPGFEGLEQACGVNVPQEIFNFLKLKHKND